MTALMDEPTEPEDPDDYDDGLEPGQEPGEPATAPAMPPPRAGKKPPTKYGIPMGDVTEFLRPEPSGDTRPSINEITSRLAAMGPGIRFRVKRLEPRLPVCESGLSDWMDLDNPTPTAEDLEAKIRDTYGGGRFYVIVRSTNNQRIEEDKIPDLPIAGDWKPTTQEGQRIWQMQYHSGGFANMPNGLPPAPQGIASETVPLLRDVIQTAAADKQQAREVAEASAARSDNTAVQLATLFQNGRQGGMGVEAFAALAGALVPVVTALIQSGSENRRAAEERAASAAQRADERFERMIAEMKTSQSPLGQAEATASMVRMIEKRAEAELQTHSEVTKKVMGHAIDMALASGRGDEPILKTAFANMLTSMGPSLASSIGQILPALVMGREGGAAQQPQYVANPNAMMAPGSTQAPVFLPQPPPPAPATEAQAAPAPPEASPVPQPSPSPSPPGPDPAVQARESADRACAMVLHQLRLFVSGDLPEVSAAWEVRPDSVHTLDTLWGLSPMAFRKAMAAVDPDDGQPLRPTAWAAGLSELPSHHAALLEQSLTASPAGVEWLRHFMLDGPWVEGDDE